MPAAASFWWMDRMAAATDETPDWLTEVGQRVGLTLDGYHDEIAWLAAAEIVQDWPQQFFGFLDVFQQIDKHRNTATGVGRRLPITSPSPTARPSSNSSPSGFRKVGRATISSASIANRCRPGKSSRKATA
jgi:hypothetical protein